MLHISKKGQNTYVITYSFTGLNIFYRNLFPFHKLGLCLGLLLTGVIFYYESFLPLLLVFVYIIQKQIADIKTEINLKHTGILLILTQQLKCI